MNFLALLVVAVLVEAVWEALKPLWEKEKGISFDQIGVFILGILVCVAAEVDLFAVVGIELTIPFLGAVLTGIIVARGSNYLHELVGALKTARVVEFVELEEIKTHIGEVVKDE